jgi:hypothetical protein
LAKVIELWGILNCRDFGQRTLDHGASKFGFFGPAAEKDLLTLNRDDESRFSARKRQ